MGTKGDTEITNLREDGFGASGIHVDDHTIIHKMLNAVSSPTNLVANDPTYASHNVQQIQAAINEAITDRNYGSIQRIGSVVLLPPGDYFVNSTIFIQTVMRLQLYGLGTRLIWNGANPDITLLALLDARQCVIDGIDVVATTPLRRAMESSNSSAITGMTPTVNHFRNIYIDGGAQMVDGIALNAGEATEWTNANNDFMLFECVEITGYTRHGFALFGSQSYNNQFVNCRCLASANNDGYGVYAHTLGGSFKWSGGGMYANKKADFFVGRSFQPYIIDSFNSEGSARFLEIGTVAYATVHVRGLRYSMLNLHADGRIITGTPTQCHVKIESSSISESVDKAAEVYISPSNSTNSTLVIENVRIKTTLENAFTGMQPTRSEGIWYW